MKPQNQIKLMYELERLKRKENKFLLPGAIIGLLACSLFFINRLLQIAEKSKINEFNTWPQPLLLLIFFGLILVFLYRIIENRMNKKIISLIETILDKTDESIQKEKVELDEID